MRHTLAIILAAQPIENDEMFPDYNDASNLCSAMTASLSKWNDAAFVENAVHMFAGQDARKGMQLAREKVYFYLPDECNWKYFDD